MIAKRVYAKERYEIFFWPFMSKLNSNFYFHNPDESFSDFKARLISISNQVLLKYFECKAFEILI